MFALVLFKPHDDANGEIEEGETDSELIVVLDDRRRPFKTREEAVLCRKSSPELWASVIARVSDSSQY